MTATPADTVVVNENASLPEGADAPTQPAKRDVQAEIQALLSEKEKIQGPEGETMEKEERAKRLRSIRAALRQRGHYVQGPREPKAEGEAATPTAAASADGSAQGDELVAEGYGDNTDMSGDLAASPLVDEVEGNQPGVEGDEDEADTDWDGDDEE